MKRKMQTTKTSIIDMVDFMMAQTGLNRQQATIAFDTILHYFKQHPREPLSRITGYLFGNDEKNQNSSLN